MYENYKDLLITRSGKILTVALNAPERLNAINATMHEELSRIFYDLDADRETEVVILTGSGRAFCAGGDIKDMQAWYEQPALFDGMAREARKIIFGMLECDKPILCKMNGAAYGLGATLALFCDLIFADDRAKIADPHVSVGLSAGDGGVSFRAVWWVGRCGAGRPPMWCCRRRTSWRFGGANRSSGY